MSHVLVRHASFTYVACNQYIVRSAVTSPPNRLTPSFCRALTIATMSSWIFRRRHLHH